MADINLIPQEEKASERVESMQKRLQIFSVVFLIICAIAAVVTLALFATFSSKRTALVAQVSDSSAKIDSFKSQEELLVVISDKTSVASTLLTSRTDLADFFKKLAALLPQGVYFSDIRIAEGKISLSGKARSSSEIAGLATSLTSSEGAKIVVGVSIDSLSSDESGAYSFVASAKLAGFQVPVSVPAASEPDAVEVK